MKNHTNVVIACLTTIAVALVLTSTYKKRNRANDIVVVTGSAKQNFDSDLIVWRGSYSRMAKDIREANELLRKDTEQVKAFIQKQGLKLEDFVFSAVGVQKITEYVFDKAGNRSEQFRGYQLTQNLSIESGDIEQVETLSRVVTDLLQLRIEFISSAPEYYYTKLGALKIEMIASATKDGRLRAEKIAENAAGKIGGLRFSSLGIFQITAPNTNEDPSWSGAFSTNTRKKSAAVTIKLQFGLEG